MIAINPILIALALSLVGNAWLGWSYLGQRDATTAARADVRTVTGERDDARATASACSDAAEDARDLAAKRAREADAARLVAAGAARGHKEAADKILRTPAAVPGDDCKSAQQRVNTWQKGRAKP